MRCPALLLVPLIVLTQAISAVAYAGNPPIMVNVSYDGPNQAVDGSCDADTAAPGLQCTLRAAVQVANANNGPDTIVVPLNMSLTLTFGGSGGAELGDLDITENLIITSYMGIPPADVSELPSINAVGLNDRIFDIAPGVSVTLRGLHLSDGTMPGSEGGGAVRNRGQLLVDTVSFTGNSANTVGGAIASVGAGASLQVFDSHFESNQAVVSSGAAISVGAGSQAEIARSSFISNSAGSTNATIHAFYDGTLGSASLSISDSYIIASGSAVAASDPGMIALRNVTIEGSVSGYAVSIVNLRDDVPVDIANSILADGGLASCRITLAPGSSAPDIHIGNSLVQSDSGCAPWFHTVRTGLRPDITSPSSEPWRLTRFPTPNRALFTHDLGVFSPIDAGIAADAVPVRALQACTSTDMRGQPRPQDGNLDGIARCDVGAVELDWPDSSVFLVNHYADDLVDANPGDGICETAPGNGQCTLRAAVMEANAKPGFDAIRFSAGGQSEVQLTLPPQASADGGDLDITEGVLIHGLAVDGRPVTTIRQTVEGERVFEANFPKTQRLILRDLQLVGGSSSAISGGALRITGGAHVDAYTLEMYDNSAVHGGAISVVSGALLLADSDLHHNETAGDGAALFVGANTTARVHRSSFWANSDLSDSAAATHKAVYLDSGATADMFNSTIAFNSGGIHAVAPERLRVEASTIAFNEQPGIHTSFDAAVNDRLVLRRNILAGNQFSDCLLINQPAAHTLTIDAWNLIQDDTCTAAMSTNFAADPLLVVSSQPLPLLQPAGRLSRVLPLLNSLDGGSISPAIDVAPLTGCQPTDQRGVPRPQVIPTVPEVDGPCDLGAYEAVPLPAQTSVFADGFEG